MSLSAVRRRTLPLRSRILWNIRSFFHGAGFCEVETPHRIPSPLPELHIDLFDSEGWYLHPSPEGCMKRLLARGFDTIFQISRCWRKGERGKRHLPEFTLLEWYRRGCDYRALLSDCTSLLRTVAAGLETNGIEWGGHRVDLGGEWEILTVREAFSRHGSMTPEEALARNRFDEIMAEQIEPRLGVERPTFLVDYPVACGSLARRKSEDPSLVERLELYVAGVELANGFTELTDPAEQRKRFSREEENRISLGKSPYPEPERFLRELGQVGEAAGIALGVDRLVMLFSGTTTIDEVVSFTPEEL